MKQLFQAVQHLLTHHNKELRGNVYTILRLTYERCKEPVTEFVAGCSGLRPVQAKELAEMLSKADKVSISCCLFEEDTREVQVASRQQRMPERAEEQPSSPPV